MINIMIIAGGLQVGGAERVAANISRYATTGEFCFHYIIFEGYENIYGAEIERNGGKVFTLPSPSKNYILYVKKLGQLMDKYHYKVVHSHTMFNSGINLAVAKYHHVPIRISHSHTTKTEKRVSAVQRVYEKIMQKAILHYSTDLLACGVDAGVWLYGKKAYEERGKIIFNGIDIESNAYNTVNRNIIRQKLNVENRFVIGHVGSLLSVKNQTFLIQLMPEILKRKSNAVLLLLGEGEDRRMLQDLITKLQLQNEVILYGTTLEVNKFLSAFDLFVFPSMREGTPLALLEAQTNGLPCIVSSNIPQDAFLTDLVKPISLENKEDWIDAVCMNKRTNPGEYSEIMARTGYNASMAYQKIYEIYRRK